MADRPIIFSAPMVRAIQAGRKTVTRRVVSGYETANLSCVLRPSSDGTFDFVFRSQHDPERDGIGHLIRCPYGKPGDTLWVRETHALRGNEDGHYVDAAGELCGWRDAQVIYRADTTGAPYGLAQLPSGGLYDGPWRPSIYMRREHSRIELRVESVRVERLHQITDEEGEREGVTRLFTQAECDVSAGLVGSREEDHGWSNYLWHGHVGMGSAPIAITQAQSDRWGYQFSGYKSARDSFSSAWEALHGGGAWERNPWVWRVEFSRVEAASG